MPARIWSIQAHPEFTEFIMSSVLKVRHETGVFNDEQYTDGKSRAGKKTDGENLGREIVKFITESCAK
jgi:GMP synthase (glutamine-hydrolysing)